MKKEDGFALRKSYLGKSRRIVVKVGSAVLTSKDGLDLSVMENLARDISLLIKSGKEVILVSSGAVAAGKKRLGLQINRTLELKEKQGAAAVGQSSLMRFYEDIFDRLGYKVAQVLLTHDDLSNRNRYLNVRNTILTLLEWKIIPVINENDTVSVEELRFGDNDTLGALITNLIEADLFVCLTDVDGLYTGNPHDNPQARPVYTVAKVDKKVETMAGYVVGALGSGGMQSKIQAARMVSARGGSSFIGSGRKEGIMQQLFACEPVGTFFLPQVEKMQSRKHWIAYVLRPQGYIVLDQGACKALIKGGKSLLPSGILEIRGTFGVGAPVKCLDENGNAIASGLSNYSASDLNKIKGLNTGQIEETLGYKDSDEAIHRDNLVIL
ncbi:MAG: glutamate 5-kinase [Desulfobulbaceae bacterium]|nr:glutamate 5-kinase [Desulfobulbaceae bacterium]MDH3782301.1 glutamate 5-kinase [Desulfobulbaceae bacterium]MDH3921379.1 glutamate 5-kinase [Desulfobulbaceae bacterium]